MANRTKVYWGHNEKVPTEVECGSSAVEYRTRNQVIPGSNRFYYRFEDWEIFFSAMPQFTQLYKLVAGYRQWWKYEWLECFPEKSSWCQNEQVCQGGGV